MAALGRFHAARLVLGRGEHAEGLVHHHQAAVLVDDGEGLLRGRDGIVDAGAQRRLDAVAQVALDACRARGQRLLGLQHHRAIDADQSGGDRLAGEVP